MGPETRDKKGEEIGKSEGSYLRNQGTTIYNRYTPSTDWNTKIESVEGTQGRI